MAATHLQHALSYGGNLAILDNMPAEGRSQRQTVQTIWLAFISFHFCPARLAFDGIAPANQRHSFSLSETEWKIAAAILHNNAVAPIAPKYDAVRVSTVSCERVGPARRLRRVTAYDRASP